METRREGRAHTLTIDMCRRAVISGVEELESFQEEMISVYTAGGLLTIEGEELHIDRLNLEEGQLILSGVIYAALYTEDAEPRAGLLSRLFKR
jgi:sporulation protein YabP